MVIIILFRVSFSLQFNWLTFQDVCVTESSRKYPGLFLVFYSYFCLDGPDSFSEIYLSLSFYQAIPRTSITGIFTWNNIIVCNLLIL